jgi:uncharacterized membrane protein
VPSVRHGTEQYTTRAAAGLRRRGRPVVVFADVAHERIRVPATANAERSNTAVFVLLGLASAMCLALVAARTVYAHVGHFQFLIWNLFLAWIPLALAALAYRIATRRGALARVIVVPTAIVWLLFFPNAPYIVTDFVHLGQFHDRVPGWYDVMLIAWFAWTGLMLGVVSLRLMQEIVSRAAGAVAGWVMVALVTALGSVGIYLGRFLGWNSWDVFQAPLALADKAWDRANQPNADVRMFGFTVLFALLFLFIYVAVYLVGRPAAEP